MKNQPRLWPFAFLLTISLQLGMIGCSQSTDQAANNNENSSSGINQLDLEIEKSLTSSTAAIVVSPFSTNLEKWA